MSNFVALGCLKVGEMFSVGGGWSFGSDTPYPNLLKRGHITITVLTLLEGALSSKIRAICGP